MIIGILFLISITCCLSLTNILVIVSDDLNPIFLDPSYPVSLPNLQRFASQGTTFGNAFTAFPVCGPSRQAFMAGRHAINTKIYTFERFIPQVPGLTTVSKYMLNNFGYEASAWGKVYHNIADNIGLSMFYAGHWSRLPVDGGTLEGVCGGKWFCSSDPVQHTGDYQLATTVINYLSKRPNPQVPFLTFIGLRKPHLEVGFPVEYDTLSHPNIQNRLPLTNEPASIQTSDGSIIPFRKSLSRFDCWYEIAKLSIDGLRAYPATQVMTTQHNLNITWTNMRAKYYGAVQFFDAQVGRLLDYIENSPQYSANTAIVLISDHGFAMGEHGQFCKNALFDQQTRSAFMIIPPKSDTTSPRGVINNDPVSLIDLFPTLVHLGTGQVLPYGSVVDNSSLPLDGQSVYQQDRSTLSAYAFMTYPRCKLISTPIGYQCVNSPSACGRIPNIFFGFAVRTSTVRYVEWRPYNDNFTKCVAPTWFGLKGSAPKYWQIDPVQTGTIWSSPPTQREMFEEYPQAPFTWGNWEYSNVLVDRLGNAEDAAHALELGCAIRWRFDPNFAPGGAAMPCSGNGFVRLSDYSKWTTFVGGLEPTFGDIVCDCFDGFTGNICQSSRRRR